MNVRKAVFIDLYGTLIEDHGVAERVAHIKFKLGAIKALKRMEDAGYIAFVSVCHETITVPGPDYVKQLQAHVLAKVAAQGVLPASIHFTGTDVQAQPMTIDAIRALAQQHKLSLPHCVVVGDMMKDVQIGREAGARTALLNSEVDTPAYENTDWVEPDYVIADLGELADKILHKRQ